MVEEPKPSVTDVLPLVDAIYARHAAGCCLHILTDDGNVSDVDAAFCLELATKTGHRDCEEAAGLLVRMSRTQRTKIALDLRRPNGAGRTR